MNTFSSATRAFVRTRLLSNSCIETMHYIKAAMIMYTVRQVCRIILRSLIKTQVSLMAVVATWYK